MFARFVTKIRAVQFRPPRVWKSTSLPLEATKGKSSDEDDFEAAQKPFQVCKARITNESQMIRDANMRQQTQPSLLPEFYNPKSDFSGLQNEKAAGQPQFAASKTVRSITVPLKSSRLASPFPEPVKLMPSHQVSDQEKAQRMYDDSRMAGSAGSHQSR